MSEYQLLIGGEGRRSASGDVDEIRSPFDARIVGTVPIAGAEDIEAAIRAAQSGARLWRRTPAHERASILLKAADLVAERTPEIARVLSAENGKHQREALAEVTRCADLIRLAAFEGSQLYGDSLPLDANAGTGLDKIGFTVREPVGIVAAITPFNYPALLVLHKVAPALATGNAVILKPARTTPLTALTLAQCFLDAGVTPEAISVLNGPGGAVGDALVGDRRIRKVSFTGSTAVGEHITRTAGVKKLSLELGASSPVIIMPDADLEKAASAVAAGGYANSGEVCISVQRVIAHEAIAEEFVEILDPMVQAITAGDPSAESSTIGAMISQSEAARVHERVQAALAEGARLVTGGEYDGAVHQATLLTDVDPDSSISQEELFGPAVAVSTAGSIAEAINIANSTPYGLATGIFTNRTSDSIRAIREVEAGVVHINWTPLWRADLMPYGGAKASGIGKEGVRSAVEEMTEIKTVVLHGEPW